MLTFIILTHFKLFSCVSRTITSWCVYLCVPNWEETVLHKHYKARQGPEWDGGASSRRLLQPGSGVGVTGFSCAQSGRWAIQTVMHINEHVLRLNMPSQWQKVNALFYTPNKQHGRSMKNLQWSWQNYTLLLKWTKMSVDETIILDKSRWHNSLIIITKVVGRWNEKTRQKYNVRH